MCAVAYVLLFFKLVYWMVFVFAFWMLEQRRVTTCRIY